MQKALDPPWLAAASRYSAVPLRLAVGIIFLAHGCQKIFGAFGGGGLAATQQAFETFLGIPAPLAVLASFTEFLGGALLIAGLLTRISALGLAAVMTVALFKVHWVHGFFLNWYGLPGQGHGIEYNLTLLGACLSLALSGAGAWSLDGKIKSTSNAG